MTTDDSPRVFISYAWDSPEHKELVRRFATFLRVQVGIDVHLDRWDEDRRRDWAAWASHHLRRADFIIVIASPEYRRRADGQAAPNEGRGTQFEAAIIRDNLVRDLPRETQRVLPVVLPGGSVEGIPTFLCGHSTTHYRIDALTINGVENLRRAFARQSTHPLPHRGPYERIPVTSQTPSHAAITDPWSTTGVSAERGRQCQHTQPTLPYRAGITPLRAASFQRRETVLRQVGQAGTTLLTGLGGVGKTQVALDYAEGLWTAREIDLLAWITADSREAVIKGYADLAVDLTGIEDSDPEQAARRLQRWLGDTSTRWLIVLDDIQEPADLRSLWPPTSATGRVVATTRRRDAALRGHDRIEVNIDVFSGAESESYLRATFATGEHLLTGATTMAATLGHLPLALAQAGAYMLDRNLSCTDYLSRFTDRRRTLASLFPDVRELPDEHRATVATTWSLSIELADNLIPAGLASPLLAIASLLDANGIPLELFTTSPILAFLASAGTDRAVTAEDSRDGLGCLHRLSLITLDPRRSARAVRVHALVQRVTRDNIPLEWLERLTHVTARALNDVWPDEGGDLTLTEVLQVNTDALESATDGRLWACGCRRILFQSGFQPRLQRRGRCRAGLLRSNAHHRQRPPGV
ncbi:SEFIR domain-containing protein [Amycolatopsis lurida]